MTQRVIKFRAWDGIRMTTSGIQFSATDGKLTMINNYPIMQFTGLMDKNGKEIYEGDVVLNKNWTNRKQNLTVQWNDKEVKYVLHPNSESMHGWIDLGSCDNLEIIGNIYQNPEQLNEK